MAIWDFLAFSLIPSTFGNGKGVKSNPSYPEVGDLVYSNRAIQIQSTLGGDYDVIIPRNELVGQVVRMNVADNSADYLYNMEIKRPYGSLVYLWLGDPTNDTWNPLNNEYYRVLANTQYNYPVSNSGTTSSPAPTPSTGNSPIDVGDNPVYSSDDPTDTGTTTTQTGGSKPKTIPKTPTTDEPPFGQRIPTPGNDPAPESKPNFWLIGGIVVGGIAILIILFVALSDSPQKDSLKSQSRSIKMAKLKRRA